VVLVYIGVWGSVVFWAVWYSYMVRPVIALWLGRCGIVKESGLGSVVFRALWYRYIDRPAVAYWLGRCGTVI
jgi:hypothetical protein